MNYFVKLNQDLIIITWNLGGEYIKVEPQNFKL